MNSAYNPSMNFCLIDLTTQKITKQSYSFQDPQFKNFLGCEGFAIAYLLKNTPPNVEPLSPENHICFITGILSGTSVPFSGRYFVAGKSPLTRTWGEANSGGRFGPELRKTGINLLIITGKAKDLSIIKIMNDKIEIEPASYLHGLDCIETERTLRDKLGSKIQVASIGLAGENQVLYSGIVTDKGRIAARCGLGAVMGSKNLKAIAVRGSKKVPIYDPEGLRGFRVLFNKVIKKGPSFLLKPTLRLASTFAPWLRRFRVKNYSAIGPSSVVIESYRRWGTCAGTAVCVETGDAPVKNYQGSYKDFPLEKSVKITSDNVTQYQTRKYGCHSCPLACGGVIAFQDDRYNLPETLKPEYETLAILGSNLLNDDLGSIYALNDYCNRQGLDTISVGLVLSFLMEAREKQIVNDEDLEGLKLIWGETSDLLPLLQKITKREGIGNLLAEGLEKVTEEIGKNSEIMAIHIRNQGIPAHDPRFMPSYLIPYKLDPAPGRHTPFVEHAMDLAKFHEMFPSLDKKNRVFDYYMYHQAYSSLGMCQFGLVTGNFPIIEFVNLVTGLNLNERDLITAGERIFTLKHLFNLREGINPLNNNLPKRILNKASDGPNRDVSLVDKEEEILNEFLTALNWDTKTTMPDHDRLAALGLKEFGKILKTQGN
ncbi:MAG: aldehyde ferredoxin oxidoreductase family protein [Candidatus Hodarchaeota archaeon]